VVEFRALACPAGLSDDLADAFQFARNLLIGRDDLVEGLGDLAVHSGPIGRKLDGEISVPHVLQSAQELAPVE
jgi:hypothetical protein